jgi:hypothetical protein
MGLKYTKIPNDTFEKLQMNAGILVDSFNPATGVIGNILGATTGGIQFQSNPSYTDFGEDVDNCPNNMMELKHVDQFDPQMSGTFLTCTPAVIASLTGAADIDVSDTTKVVPRADLLATDFDDLWWIGDYSNVNTGDNAGFLAIHLMNALNQQGFQIQSTKNNKGQMAFEYHGHYSVANQDVVPFEIYCKAGVGTATVTQRLTHVTSSFSETTVDTGDPLTATLTADTGYTISSVTDTMCNVDVTSTAWDESTSKVTIAEVTGAVIITATAIED